MTFSYREWCCREFKWIKVNNFTAALTKRTLKSFKYNFHVKFSIQNIKIF